MAYVVRGFVLYTQTLEARCDAERDTAQEQKIPLPRLWDFLFRA
jgi:hypothetical protein